MKRAKKDKKATKSKDQKWNQKEDTEEDKKEDKKSHPSEEVSSPSIAPLTGVDALCLRLTPTAWSKFQYMQREMRPNEVSGFGIASDPEDPLLITDIYFPKQEVASTSTKPDEEDVRQYFDDKAAEGLHPYQYFRVWIHSHPFGTSKPVPSPQDWQTFSESLGDADWAIMLIIGAGAEHYCMMRVRHGVVNGLLPIPCRIEWGVPVPEEAGEWEAQLDHILEENMHWGMDIGCYEDWIGAHGHTGFNGYGTGHHNIEGYGAAQKTALASNFDAFLEGKAETIAKQIGVSHDAVLELLHDVEDGDMCAQALLKELMEGDEDAAYITEMRASVVLNDDEDDDED